MTRRSLTVPLPPLWLLSNVLFLALTAGVVYAEETYFHVWSNSSAAAEPRVRSSNSALDNDDPEAVDRVVNIERKCEPLNPRGENSLRLLGCEAMGSLVKNDRLVLTVRSAAGGSYYVDVPVGTRVKVGDPWP